MRYQCWDALLFSADSKAPLQEFKTACHVIQDLGLPSGQPFRLSLHCWEDPKPSQWCMNVTQEEDVIKYEARIFIDGIYAASERFEQMGPWPAIIESTPRKCHFLLSGPMFYVFDVCDYYTLADKGLDKKGEREPLLFPSFHREILAQNYWNAGDDLGRIKILVAEVIERHQTSVAIIPYERIRNVVAFSFQHAPLDVLETSAIAWPNPTMWRQAPNEFQIFPQYSSPKKFRDISGSVIHTHSPRTLPNASRPEGLGLDVMRNVIPSYASSHVESSIDHRRNPWRHMSSDVSMLDYSSSASGGQQSRRGTGPLEAERLMSQNNVNQSVPPAPTNTPQNMDTNLAADMSSDSSTSSPSAPKRKGNGLDHETSPTCIPALHAGGVVKSRKENLHKFLSSDTNRNSSPRNESARKAAQPFQAKADSRHKRPRIVTPVASKVIDAEDQPRSSTRRRHVVRYSDQHTQELTDELTPLEEVETNVC